MDVKIEASWKKALASEFEKEYFKKLRELVRDEYFKEVVYPKPENIFQAFDMCPLENVKVVILGQDPYHGPRQAHGLCFSVQKGVQNPPSLINIFKEIEDDLGIKMSFAGDLTPWARQGVFLLNATLTVIAGKAGSHQRKGWEEFSDSVIRIISQKKENVVFLLWGAYAQSKESLIDKKKHLVLMSPHPSPLSAYRGFFGNKHFSKTNKHLDEHGIAPIIWEL